MAIIGRPTTTMAAARPTRARRRRAGLATLAGSVFGCLVITGTVSAGFWRPTVVLRGAPAVHLEDFEASVGIVVGWSEPGRLWARSSFNAGADFSPRYRFAVDPSRTAAELSLAVPSSSIVATWIEDRRTGAFPDRWRVMIGERSITGGAVTAQQAIPNQRHARSPQIGTSAGRVWIAYQERAGTSPVSQVKVWHSLRGSVGASVGHVTLGDAPTRLGPAQLAATTSRGHVAWADAAGIHFRAADVGPGPAYTVSWNAERLVSSSGSHPKLAIVADQAIVAWSHQGDLWVRVSDDVGVTWGPAQRLLHGTSSRPWRPLDVDIAGSQVVLVARAEGDGNDATHRLRSGTGGTSWEPSEFVKLADLRLAEFMADEVGYLKLSEAWSDARISPDPQRLSWRRQDQ